jgi:predicted dehydrogenase
MKILIIGLGSIGRRHLKVLQNIGGIQISALRTNKGTLSGSSDITEFTELNDALKFNPDGVIVANPTAFHVESARPFLMEGAKLLIEKPISHSWENALELATFSSQIRIAYCMRFLPVSDFFKNGVDIEHAFKLSFKRSFYLPKWHPYADYRKEYTARKDLGGGVIRTLSHEIDLACHWLGNVSSVIGVVDHLSPLEIDVDDFAFFSMKMKNGARANLELDYFSPVNINYGELFNNTGKFWWNSEGLFFMAYDSNKVENVLEFRDVYSEIYQKQMIDFISFIVEGKSLNCTFEEAIEIAKIIDAVEKQKPNEKIKNGY